MLRRYHPPSNPHSIFITFTNTPMNLVVVVVVVVVIVVVVVVVVAL